jgi:hypothetical protein
LTAGGPQLAWLLALVLFVQDSAMAAAGPRVLLLRDDRGHPITTPVEVCFQLALRADCAHVAGGHAELPPEPFRSVRIEGDEHGPYSARANEVVAEGAGRFVVRVPRKAWLRIEGSPPSPLTLFLYAVNDESFRRAAFRATIASGVALRVPAGDWLASLSRPGSAPDLHLLSLGPAESARARYRERHGWSAVVRCRSAATERPLRGATVVLRGAPGFERGGERRAATGVHGLALFPGLDHALATATAEHSRHVPRELHGLAASPGTFAFEEARLEVGGGFQALVLREGEPAAARCRVLDLEREMVGGRRGERTAFEGRTGAAGTCGTATGLAPRGYVLEVSLPGQTATYETALEVRSGEVTELRVDLAPIRLSGRVTLGGRPAPGWRVEVSRSRSPARSGSHLETVLEAIAGEDGGYEAVLWMAGDYTLMPLSPAGTPSVDFRNVSLESSEEVVDFDLPTAAVRGVVVDERGTALPGARVTLREARMARVAETSADGEFEILVESGGSARLFAFKPGYVLAEPVEVVVPEGGSPPPTTLRMRPSGLLRGTVRNAAGPIAGAWVATRPETPPEAAIRSATTAADGQFEVELASTPGRLFFGGPGCALTVRSIATAEEAVDAACSEPPAALVVHVRDADDRPVPHVAIRLRQGATVLPHAVLVNHLAGFGVTAESDGTGRLALVALAPGSYDLFLADRSSEESILQGSPSGYLDTVDLMPLAVTELEVALPPG